MLHRPESRAVCTYTFLVFVTEKLTKAAFRRVDVRKWAV